MSVPGEDQLGSVAFHSVQHPLVRGMCHPEAEVHMGRERPCDVVVPVQAQMRVVHSASPDPPIGYLEEPRLVVEVQPPRGGQTLVQDMRVDRAAPGVRAAGPAHVLERIAALGREVIIRAAHEEPSSGQKWVEGCERQARSGHVTTEIPGDHSQVRSELSQAFDPGHPVSVPWCEVEVGKVKDPQRSQMRAPDCPHEDLDSHMTEGVLASLPCCIAVYGQSESSGSAPSADGPKNG
jgi:hypothetical protein